MKGDDQINESENVGLIAGFFAQKNIVVQEMVFQNTVDSFFNVEYSIDNRLYNFYHQLRNYNLLNNTEYCARLRDFSMKVYSQEIKLLRVKEILNQDGIKISLYIESVEHTESSYEFVPAIVDIYISHQERVEYQVEVAENEGIENESDDNSIDETKPKVKTMVGYVRNFKIDIVPNKNRAFYTFLSTFAILEIKSILELYSNTENGHNRNTYD